MSARKRSSAARERGLAELYAADPERADALVFGRRTDRSRRGFLKGAGLATMAAALGAPVVCWRNFPAGLIPAALAEGLEDFVIEGKDGLRVLGDRPVNAETPAHLLDDGVTPTARHFVRNNGIPPANMDPSSWRLTVDGEVDNPLTLGIDDLRRDFQIVDLQLQLECGGNGRAAFNPPARGNQWTVGAVGNAQWSGVRYRDVIRAAGFKENSAVYTGHYGADTHLSGQPGKVPISRGIPISKALEPHTLIAFEMNGEPIHPMNGAPLRVVAPGWPGSCSQKWLTRIWVRDQVHDGAKMTGSSYRVPKYPVAPGQKVADEDMRIIEAMPVKSLITYPRSGLELQQGRAIEVRGHAWAGELEVSAVDVTIDFGATWRRAKLELPVNKYAWQRWRAALELPVAGYYEVWARATDANGVMQPFAVAWNPKGYLNNSLHRIAIRVTA